MAPSEAQDLTLDFTKLTYRYYAHIKVLPTHTLTVDIYLHFTHRESYYTHNFQTNAHRYYIKWYYKLTPILQTQITQRYFFHKQITDTITDPTNPHIYCTNTRRYLYWFLESNSFIILLCIDDDLFGYIKFFFKCVIKKEKMC